MDYRDRAEVEQMIRAMTRGLAERTTFFDDYEGDCIEIWDAIEGLQKDVKELQTLVRRLAKMNGLKMAVKEV